jgi:hypothetical protein
MPRDVCNGGKEGAGCRVRQGAGSVGAVVSHVRGMWMYCIGLPRARPPVWLTVGRGRSRNWNSDPRASAFPFGAYGGRRALR